MNFIKCQNTGLLVGLVMLTLTLGPAAVLAETPPKCVPELGGTTDPIAAIENASNFDEIMAVGKISFDRFVAGERDFNVNKVVATLVYAIKGFNDGDRRFIADDIRTLIRWVKLYSGPTLNVGGIEIPSPLPESTFNRGHWGDHKDTILGLATTLHKKLLTEY